MSVQYESVNSLFLSLLLANFTEMNYLLSICETRTLETCLCTHSWFPILYPLCPALWFAPSHYRRIWSLLEFGSLCQLAYLLCPTVLLLKEWSWSLSLVHIQWFLFLWIFNIDSQRGFPFDLRLMCRVESISAQHIFWIFYKFNFDQETY